MTEALDSGGSNEKFQQLFSISSTWSNSPETSTPRLKEMDPDCLTYSQTSHANHTS